jgi:glutathione S-transferase
MITLYHVGESRSMRTLWLLNELGLPFDVVELPWDMKHLRAPAYLAISPLGRVPALVDDGRAIIESGAIAQYLCARYDRTGLGRPTDHPEWLDWIQWIHFSETIAVHAACLVQQKFFIAPDQRSEAVAKLESRRLLKALEVVDRALEGRDYLLPSGFSAADVAVGYSIHMGKLFFEPEGLANVQAYYERLSRRPAFQASVKPAELAAAPV